MFEIFRDTSPEVEGLSIDEAFLDDLEEVLYNSDLGPVGTRVVDDLKAAYKRREVKDIAEVPGFLRTRLLALLAPMHRDIITVR